MTSSRTNRRSSPSAYLPVVVTGAVLAAVPPAVGDSRYVMALAIDVLILAAYGVGFNVIFGSTGQLVLCLGALAGVAAYASVLLGALVGVPLVVAVTIGTLLAAALGALLSLIAVRRRLDAIFLGIVTLAFSLVFTTLLLGGRDLTGGETGLVVDAVDGGGELLRSQVVAYYLLLGLLVVYLGLYRFIGRSRLGWAFRSLKDDSVAAELAGIDVARAKVTAAAVGSAIVGLTGALFAAHDGFISPTAFDFGHLDVRVLVVLATGGIGSLLGPVVGAGVLTGIDELLRPLGQLRLTVYGIVLIAVFLRFRDGIVPVVGRLWQRGAGLLTRRSLDRSSRPPTRSAGPIGRAGTPGVDEGER